jgi:hypothetical protein
MAANIHLHQPRVEVALTEHDDTGNGEPAAPDGQASPQSETSIAAPAEQHSHGDGGSSDAGSHDPSTPPPPPAEAEASTPFPAQFRYGLGEVSIGRPEYVRFAANEADRAQPNKYETAFAPTPRAENTPPPPPPPFPLPALPANLFNDLPIPLDTTDFAHAAPMQTAFTSVDAVAARMTASALAGAPGASPATPAASATKPIPVPKPTGIMSPTPAPASPPSLSKPAATVSPTITNAPSINGETVEKELPSNRTPYLYPGLHTAPEQSPHYANALAYGREQGYSDDEVMKLAVLMQANRDQNMGREWLTLKPPVLRAAVNAVVRNPDNSFDTSGVFGGQRGYHSAGFASQQLPADAHTAAYMSITESSVAEGPYTAPDGWVLEERETSSGDAGSDIIRYYRPSDELIAANDAPYLPLLFTGYMQVPRGYESELSVGADGGMHDLSALDFDPEFGLVTRSDNYRPYSADGNDWDRFMEIAVVVTISAGAMAAIGPVVAAGMGASTAGVVAAGAINGVIGSAITTMLQEGEVTFRGLLQAAFSGGMLAGLSTLESYQALNNLGRDATGATHFALRAMSITGTSTIRGAIQELIGGRFRDGFTQGIVQGLSSELTNYLNAEISAGLANEQITPAQADALRELTRFTGSALRAAANPNDPMYAFAQDYLGQLFGPPEARTIAGNGDTPLDAETQQDIAWFREAVDSGYDETAAGFFNNIVERRAAANPTASRTDIANNLIRELAIKPDTLGFVVGANGNVTVAARVDRATAVERIAAAYRLNDPTISQQEAERAANAYIDQRGIPAVFPERLMLTVVVRPDKPLPFTTGSEIVDQIIGAFQGAVMTGYNYVSGILHGVVDIGRIPFDGLLDIVNKLIGEDVFADSAQRNTARVDMFNNIVANLDQLPDQVAQYFNGRLERANQMDAAGDHIGAARERTELIGDLISMITNPRAPGAMRILERLGVDPATFERTTRTQTLFRQAMLDEERRLNPSFANVDARLYQAHHTIPLKDFPQLADLRGRLQAWGIDINGVDNGVMLPTGKAPADSVGMRHSLLRDPGYGEAIRARFDGINDAAAARRELAAINNELRNGTFQFTPGKK